jgi:hypothetical protein
MCVTKNRIEIRYNFNILYLNLNNQLLNNNILKSKNRTSHHYS